MERISIKTVQRCQVSDDSYSKDWFIKVLLDKMSQEEFNKFCKEICHLNEHYDSTVGLFATDRPDIVNHDLLFEINETDLHAPVNFKRK